MLSQIKSAIGWLLRQPRFLFILFLMIGLPIGAYHGYQTTRALIIDGFLASNVRSFLVSPSEKQTKASYWLAWKERRKHETHGYVSVTHVYDVSANELAINPFFIEVDKVLEGEETSKVGKLEQILIISGQRNPLQAKARNWPPPEHLLHAGEETSYHAAEINIPQPPVVNLPGCTEAGKMVSFEHTLERIIRDMEATKHPDWVTRPLRWTVKLHGDASATTTENRIISVIKGFVTGELIGYLWSRGVATEFIPTPSDMRAFLEQAETWSKLERDVWSLKYSALTVALETIDGQDLATEVETLVDDSKKELQDLAKAVEGDNIEDLNAEHFFKLDRIYFGLTTSGLWAPPAERETHAEQ